MKILIIGCPGAGKSYFARKLRDVTGISLYHLDNIYWNSDGTSVDKGVFLESLSEILKLDSWIIDGNYMSTMEYRVQMCDTVFFLDFTTDVCLSGIAERKGKTRSDIPWQDTPEDDDAEFVQFIKNYHQTSRPIVLSLFTKYPDKNITVFKSRKECDEYIETLKRKGSL